MKAVIFDLDNTLYDRYATLAAVMDNNFERIKAYLNPGYNKELATAHLCALEQLFNSYGWKTLYAKLCEANFFDPENTPTYEQCDNFLVTNFEVTSVRHEFAIPTLVELRARGYKTGLITNGRHALQSAKLANLGLTPYLDSIVITGDYAKLRCGDEKNREYYKPNPDVFVYAAETLGLEPSECYYVGDNPLHDVVPSKKAGLVPVWIRSKSPWMGDASAMPEHVCDDVRGVLEFAK